MLHYSEVSMGVVRAKIQTVEDIYRLVWTAVASRRPIEASYHRRLGCFVRTDWDETAEGELRVLCYQYGGESESGLEPAGSPANWRCIVLEKLSQVKLLDDALAHSAKPFPPCILRGRSDIDAEDQPERDPQNGQ